MAAAGLYGVMSFAVRRRTQEIGVRMALGADRRRIMRMVVRQGIWQVGVGMAIGFGLGGLLGGQMKALLFRVTPWDPIVFGSTIGVLAAAGLAASLIPALRAASVDPLVALRHD
jgi:ABC-type antimicrobial peptide transport system permease subunit